MMVHREITRAIAGGIAYEFDWETENPDGSSTRVVAEASRVDEGEAYLLTMILRIRRNHREGTECEIRHRIFGIKGAVDGAVRHDRMTVTTEHSDGWHTREVREVAVRLDLKEQLAGASLAECCAAIRRFFPEGPRCGLWLPEQD